MSDPSNALTSAETPAASSSTPRVSTSVITYSYASRMVYVAPAETHDGAIDIAKETFPELQDVERERISFELNVKLKNTKKLSTAKIGRTAWPIMITSLAQYEIVFVRVAPVSQTGSAVEPPPYAPEKREYLDSQLNVAPHGPQTRSRSLVTRIVDLFTPKSS